MKKLLLSSIIVLGVCGIASAQDDAKLAKQQRVAAASAVAPTPQKAAIMPASDVMVAPATRTIADKQAAAVALPTKVKSAKQVQSPATKSVTPVTVDAAGVVVSNEEAKLKEVKAAEAKATGVNEKKNQQ